MGSRGTWKASERRIAEMLGGRRVPVTGRQRGDVPDIEHPRWAVEHKFGRVMSPRLQVAVEQAKAAAEGTDKMPLVTIEQTVGPGKANRFYVLLELSDFLEVVEHK